MVHKGWSTKPDKISPRSSSPSKATAGIALRDKSERKTKKAIVAQHFEFVNGTDPFRNKDPEVRKLVRAHVVKDASQKRKHQKKREEKGSRKYPKDSGYTIIEETEDEVLASDTDSGHTSDLSSNDFIFPTQGLE